MRYVTELFLVGRRVKQSFKIHTIFEFSLNVQWQKNQESKGFDRVTSNVASKHLNHVINHQVTDDRQNLYIDPKSCFNDS